MMGAHRSFSLHGSHCEAAQAEVGLANTLEVHTPVTQFLQAGPTFKRLHSLLTKCHWLQTENSKRRSLWDTLNI